jgi:predicted nucleic acid-binding protein
MRYVEEGDFKQLDTLFDQATSVFIASITRLELNSILERKLRDKTLSEKESSWIESQFEKDFQFFGIIQWNSSLERLALKTIRSYQLKVLDGIQLASGILSKPDAFVTSDKRLMQASKKEIRNSVFIASN